MSTLTRHHITSPLFTGSVTMRFDDSTHLCHVECTSDMEWPVRHFFFGWRPQNIQQLQQHVAEWNQKGKQLSLTTEEQELTFSIMYEAYKVKKDRLRAEQKWNKLSKSDQLKAYLYIKQYDQQLKMNNRSKMELKTYLGAYLWND